MRKKVLTNLFIAFLAIPSLLLPSCKKMQDAKITFYVSNAGDAHKWDHITVEIGGQTNSFFTPEGRNMTLGDCQEDTNATTFYLPAGTYSYKANNGTWTGNITVEGGDCRLINLRY